MSPYAAAFLGGVRRAAADPGELIARVLFYALVMVVLAALWSAAVQEVGPIAGYDYRALVWYLAAAEGAVIATKPRMIEDIGDDISSGAVATEMLRPVSVVGFRLAAEMGEAATRLAGVAVMGGLVAWALVGTPPANAGVLLLVPAILLAVACNLAAQHGFAAAAFWFDDAKAAWFLYQKFVFLLGGMLLPIEVMPDWLSDAARVLPFWATAYIPGRLISGHVEPWLLAVQVIWLVVLLGAALLVFNRGERRLQVAGG